MYVELSYILQNSIPNYPDGLQEILENILSRQRGGIFGFFNGVGVELLNLPPLVMTIAS